MKAALEVSASDLSGTITGLMSWNSTSGQMKVSDGTNVRAILRNDLKAIIGNNGTANNNIRFHRGAAGVIQFLQGGDATAEGTLSTSLAQTSGRVENYATGSLPSAGNAGRLLYDSTINFLKIDNGSTINTFVTTDGVQTITGKELTGGTASNTLRWRLPSETSANLSGLTNLSGLIAYDTTNNRVVFNNGSAWADIATSGAVPALPVTSKTANYTATTSDSVILVDGTGGAFTITLYTATGNTGKQIVITRTDETFANQITVDGNGSETIRGALTYKLCSQYESITLVSDGTNWQMLNQVIPSVPVSYTPTFTGFGTPSGVVCYRWREKNKLCVRAYFVPGTTTATIAQVSFPSGLTSSSAIATIELAGTAIINVTSNGYSSVLREPSVTYFTFGRDTGSASAYQKYNGSSWVASGNTVVFEASVPISGWEG